MFAGSKPHARIQPTDEREFRVPIRHSIAVESVVRVKDGFDVVRVDGRPMVVETAEVIPGVLGLSMMHDMECAIANGWAEVIERNGATLTVPPVVRERE